MTTSSPRPRIHTLALLAAGAAACSTPTPDHQPTFGSATARQELHAAGTGLPLTLHPIRVLERPMPRAAMALGLVLEKDGMADLAVAATPFDAGTTPWAEVPQHFGEFVRKAGGERRDHLYAEFLGAPQSGPTAVRFVVVDADGQTVLVDEQRPGDADFARTAGKDPDPMGCSVLVAERLFRLAEWPRGQAGAAEGRFEKMWRELSGSPGASDRQAMQQRVAALKKSLAGARIAVLPTRVNSSFDDASATRLAARCAERLPCNFAAPAGGAHIAVAPESNEQKVLWDLAHGLGAAVRDHAPDADHTLVIDVGIAGDRGVGFVHLALCDAHGEPVLVEFENDQHERLQRERPKSLADAERFAADWLAALLR